MTIFTLLINACQNAIKEIKYFYKIVFIYFILLSKKKS